jgi:hypothetical protein
VDGPAWLQVASNGDLSGTPGNDDVGSNTFTVRVTDAALATGDAQLTIEVTNVNDAPLADGQDLITDEDTALDIVLTGSDLDGDAITYNVTVQPQHGTLSGSAPDLTYIPEANFSGTDSFSFTVNDTMVDSAPALVSITVNNAPGEDFTDWLTENELVATPGADSDNDSISNAVEYVVGGDPAGRMDGNLLPTISSVIADPDGNSVTSPYLLFTYRRTVEAKNDPLTSIKVEWSNNITAWTNSDDTPGVVIIEEKNGFESGVDRVKVYLPASLAVNGKLFARLSVFIDVLPINDPLEAVGQAASLDEDGTLPMTLSGTGGNGSPLAFVITQQPLHGTLSGDLPNPAYTPNANYNGPDSFQFTVNDGAGPSAPATVSITVNPLEEFTQWLSGYGLTAGPGVDSDGDTISNSLEYVIGGNPADQPDAALLPTVSMVAADLDGNPGTENYLLFTYRRTDVARDDPLTSIKVEWGTDFSSPWTAADTTHGEVIQVQDVGGEAYDLVKVYIPRALASNGRLFARLGVSVAQP